MGWALGVLIALIFANALFAASEIALISLNDYKIKKMAESGDRKAQLIDDMLSQPSQFLATIQIGITLAGFLASAFAADSFADELSLYVQGTSLPIAPGVVQVSSLILITLLLSYVTLVFGELVPKRLALQKPQPIAMALVHPLRLLAILTGPFVTILSWSTNAVIRLFGIDPHQTAPEETEEEIRLMLEAGKEKGTIEDMEQFIITRAFEFNDKAVEDIMVHRTEITAISADDSLEDVIRLVTLHPFTKFPVYQGDADHMIGTIHIKDLFRYRENPAPGTFDVGQILKPPYFVFEKRKIDEVFSEMQKNNDHLAIVLDEYGGTAGLVTLEDLLEELVGDIPSEDEASF